MMERMNTSLSVGIETLKNALAMMADTSGVYQMRGEDGSILYIGKAKSLKSRVTHYTNITQLPIRLQRMVSLVRSIETLPTKNEAEALLLEASLIKKHHPRYNILLKDDKSFPYILFSDHAFPRISKYRGNKQSKGQYFGPFVSVNAMHEMLELLQKSFLLRPCADTVFNHRTRPCLQYQIKRCSAPCVGFISEQEYSELTKQAARFLNGHAGEIREHIARDMQAASDEEDYERAARLRDRLRAITAVQREHNAIPDVVDADVFVCITQDARACVYMGCYRDGNYQGHEHLFPSGTEDASAFDILSLTLRSYYATHPAPRLVLLNAGDEDELTSLADALALQTGSRIALEYPKRSSKVKALERGELFAQDAMKRRKSSDGFDANSWHALAELLHLEAPPERIEIYDNSHIMGTNAIGAMVVATPEGFEKTSYRTFNIKSDIAAGDDYGMMKEMLTRRLRPLAEGADDAVRPSLMLIDGGAAHLQTALDVLETLGVSVSVVAISKGVDRNAGREWIHLPNHAPFQLPHNDARLHLLQNLRDEAHRFAIGTHRKKRNRATLQSALDDIPNIGPKRKRALLQHFGSRADVANASLQELQKVEGISAELAKQIVEFFAIN
jgi:excinuclease ABC subunit C